MAIRYARWDSAAAATDPQTAFGLNPKQSDKWKDVVEPEEEILVGGGGLLIPKLWEGGGDIAYTMTDTTLLAYGLRTGVWNDLTEFSVGLANDGILHVFQYCKVDSVKIGCGVGKGVDVTLGIKARWKVVGTPGTPAAPTGDAYLWQRTVTLVNGSSMDVSEWEITVENNLEYVGNLDGGTTGKLVMPTELREGDEKVKLSVTCRTPLTDAVRGNMADDPVTDLTFSAVVGNGVTTKTFALAGLMNTGGDVSVPEGRKLSEYQYEFTAPANSLALTVS